MERGGEDATLSNGISHPHTTHHPTSIPTSMCTQPLTLKVLKNCESATIQPEMVTVLVL